MAYSLALAASRRARLARHASKAATEVASLAYELFYSVYEGEVTGKLLFLLAVIGLPLLAHLLQGLPAEEAGAEEA